MNFEWPGSDRDFVAGVEHVLRPVHEFYARIRSIRVEISDTDGERHVVEMTRSEIVKNIKFDRQVSILIYYLHMYELCLVQTI